MAEHQAGASCHPDYAGLSRDIVRIETNFVRFVTDDTQNADALLERARLLGDDNLLARALCLTARTTLFRGQPDIAVPCADEAVATFARMPEELLRRLAGPHAEAWRTAGNARLYTGDVEAALPRLERSIQIAELGVKGSAAREQMESGSPATSALMRCLNNTGDTLLEIRELAEAREVLHQAFAVTELYPEVVDDVPDDVDLVILNLVTIFQIEARELLASGGNADHLLDEADILLALRPARLAKVRAGGGAKPDKGTTLAAGDHLLAIGKNLLLRQKPDQAVDIFRQLIDQNLVMVRSQAECGLAEALLALDRPAEAIDRAQAALKGGSATAEIMRRAEPYLILARAYQMLGQDRNAVVMLEQHRQSRSKLDASAAKKYAGYVVARIRLERARVEAAAQERIANEFKAWNTKLQEQQAALEVQAIDLMLARKAAEEASKAKSSFLANMSHELRTPLNAILGFSEMMRDDLAGPPGPAWGDYAGMIHQAGSHLLSVIDEILDLSKIEAGKVALDIEPIDLSELAETCRLLITPMIERNGSMLVVERDPAATVVPADAVRLKQILLNLLSNAAKFTPAGGRVTFTIAAPHDGFILFQIADTGIGMTQAELKLAFELFGQAGSEFARQHQGTGLGLPIAVGLAELHRGTLTLESQKGQGTIASLRLPLCGVATTARADGGDR